MSSDSELLVGLSVEELEALADSLLAPAGRHDWTTCSPGRKSRGFRQTRNEHWTGYCKRSIS